MKTLSMAVIGMMVLGCAANGSADEKAEVAAAAHQAVVDGNTQFALALYQKLRGGDGNLFFSPYSVSTALAMTYAGARGETERQMAEAMWYPTSGEVLAKLGIAGEPMTADAFAGAFGGIIRELNAKGGKNAYELRVANALWGQQDFAFLDAFVRLVEAEYGGRIRNVDFVGATEKARRTINTWVEEQTNGKIKDLISEGAVGQMTRLVLTNAIYFKGNWASQFKEDRTQDAPFTLLDASKVQVPMMNQKAKFGYGQTDDLQVLQLPYVGNELSMVILLPEAVDGIRQLEQELTAENLAKWLDSLHEREVIVSIPKFKMTSKFSLESVLRSMGMGRAFTGAADFSGMTGRRDLFISAVIHQAYVDVNEEGTEAAAATGVVMKLTSAMPDRTPVFQADHPFLFMIRDNASGSILFFGRVSDPRPQD
ncbi:MAG: serpin family protein [Planctomycetota bacterium]|nr:serpin family protein [Planctomycetota bacterium]